MTSSERLDPLHPHSVSVAVGWVGHKLDDIAGDPVGRVEEVLVEPESNTPSWLLVKVGRFGGHRTAVPFEFAAAGVDRVWVPYPRETIRAAPEVMPQTGLDPDLEGELRRHYGMSPAAAGAEASQTASGGDGAEAAGPPDAPEADVGNGDGAKRPDSESSAAD